MAAQDGLIIREGDGLGGEAHVHPGGEVFLLARGGLAFAELKDCHVGGVLLLARVEGVEVVVCAGRGKEALSRPDVALLLDPAHGGQPPRAVLRGVAGDAVVDEEKENISGQAEVLIKPEELADGRCGERAELALDLAQKRGKARVLLQLAGDVLARIGGALGGGRGDGRGSGLLRLRGADESHAGKGGLGARAARFVPFELGAERFGGGAAAVFEQTQVEQGGVAVPAVDQAARHGGGQGDILLLAQVQNIAGHSAPPFVRS